MVLEGASVRLEPLEPRHERPCGRPGAEPARVALAGDDGREPPGRSAGWFEATLAECVGGPRGGLGQRSCGPPGVPVGLDASSCTLRPELPRARDRVVPGWPRRRGARARTSRRSSSQLEHAFERLGCMRVEFKTDARQRWRSRAALAALPARFEGALGASTCWCRGPRACATRRTSRSSTTSGPRCGPRWSRGSSQALGVLPRDVVDAADGWSAAERAVRSALVVVAEPV